MSTIKSSDEHLTLNADGSSKDIKFQANGVEKASISSAGAFTSTTIDATKLTGNLPAINGASLTGVADATKLPLAGGTLTGNLTISSTATDDNINPDLILYRNSSSPADNDNLGAIKWQGNDDGGNAFSYAQIVCKTEDVSDGTEDGLLRFYTATGGSLTEKMRLTKEGYLGIATTTPAYELEIGNTSTKGWSVSLENNVCNLRFRASANDTQTHAYFMNTNGVVGKITTLNSGTSFVTSSDYRLKENVDYDWDATTRLKQLKPARFNFIADDTNTLVDGFIAHEVSSIVPEAISGEKDAMTTDKNGDAIIDPQGIDQSKLVPLLVKTIQELEARITALEG